MAAKKMLFLLFSLDCFFYSILVATLAVMHRPYLALPGMLIFGAYGIWNNKKRKQLVPDKDYKPTLVETAKLSVLVVGIILVLLADSILGDSYTTLIQNVPFMVLSWIFGLLIYLYQYARDLARLGSLRTA